MIEINVGDRVRHSDIYIRMLRGHHKERATKADYEVTKITSVSIVVRPWGSQDKYGTQFARRYIIPAQQERIVQTFCRYCRQLTTPDMPGVVQDLDNVTGELIGYKHVGCNPFDAERELSTLPPVGS